MTHLTGWLRVSKPKQLIRGRDYGVLLIVMSELGTWRVKPSGQLTFGRAPTCDIVLPNEDRGISRNAGSFSWRAGSWWLSNTSGSSMLYLSGDLGFRADIPPGIALPLQQWHAKVRLDGVLASYILRVRLPDLDAEPDTGDTRGADKAAGADKAGAADSAGAADRVGGAEAAGTGEAAVADGAGQPGTSSVRTQPRRVTSTVTSTRLRAPLSDVDKLVLAARFEDYLTWKHSGVALPRSARDAAARIGWEPHAVAKRCENIRGRYQRIGVPGLRGPRALEELAALLISTGELSSEDLRRLPPRDRPAD